MSAEDVDTVLRELDAWRRGDREGRLTWARLEKASGFSRQSLSAKEKILLAYSDVKEAQRADRPVRKASTQFDYAQRYEREITRLTETISRYDEQWTRWVRNASLLGYDLDRLDQPLAPPARGQVRIVRPPARRR